MKPLLLFATGVLCFTQFSVDAHDEASPMKKQIIRIQEAPMSPLYSQAVKVGSMVYVTGVPGLDPKTNKVAGPTIQEQTRQALSHGSGRSSARCSSRSR